MRPRSAGSRRVKPYVNPTPGLTPPRERRGTERNGTCLPGHLQPDADRGNPGSGRVTRAISRELSWQETSGRHRSSGSARPRPGPQRAATRGRDPPPSWHANPATPIGGTVDDWRSRASARRRHRYYALWVRVCVRAGRARTRDPLGVFGRRWSWKHGPRGTLVAFLEREGWLRNFLLSLFSGGLRGRGFLRAMVSPGTGSPRRSSSRSWDTDPHR
ncbi:hypothetical protein B0T11DRAFT_135866 [Plectosphaerella cucumerina]|uniref:Uncharacterized protein n=1 Tax=Plectosphaerella cucumerina TaxID=40658 RepID=A0A8K0T6R6_9PEZI|nr:hypothetical protein B0T11DRAFT_135866 [Plectosphaerella cucumerina]